MKCKLSGKFQCFNTIDGIIEILKNSLQKKKIWKCFARLKQQPALRKLFSHPSNKSFLRFWNKNFPTEIYRNIHCTKNEEILNGKLHFLCSDFSRSSDAERANKPHRCPRKREKTKQRVRQHWTKFVWRDYVNWNWSYVQVLMVWIFLQLFFTETSTVQTGGLHDSLIVKRLETAVHARCTALIFSPAR